MSGPGGRTAAGARLFGFGATLSLIVLLRATAAVVQHSLDAAATAAGSAPDSRSRFVWWCVKLSCARLLCNGQRQTSGPAYVLYEAADCSCLSGQIIEGLAPVVGDRLGGQSGLYPQTDQIRSPRGQDLFLD